MLYKILSTYAVVAQIRTFVGFLMINHGNIRCLIHKPLRTEVYKCSIVGPCV